MHHSRRILSLGAYMTSSVNIERKRAQFMNGEDQDFINPDLNESIIGLSLISSPAKNLSASNPAIGKVGPEEFRD